MIKFIDNLLKKIKEIMSSFIDKTDRGSFASIEAVWAAIPTGGNEGDYCHIDGVKYRWDKYNRMWVNSEVYTETPARETTTFDGDVNVQNNLTVAGTIRAKGINNPCLGLFPTTSALEAKWPYPKVGWWAIIGDSIPGYISRCNTEGTWTHTSETGGGGEVDLTEYAKLTDVPEVVDNLTTDSGTKSLSARQGKVLNEKIPTIADNLTTNSATIALSAKQGKVLNEKIPVVIDNLTTSSPILALSAKQGKILKTLIDNIGSINVQGIRGLWPIDSLNDLPESPTEEQKKLAYLYENAIYIYVGEGGDTLGGKYKSTDLIDLDWGDKSYNASEFSGLGRRWLKKNIVEDTNVLTSAMIGPDNTEYYIQYDYDLDEASITLPANSTLVFMGGSIKNGTLVGNNTRIVAQKGVQIFDTVTIQGTWDVAEAYSSWFKMHKGGYKIASVNESGVTKYKGSDNNYYDLDELRDVSGTYYVTSSLEDEDVVEGSISITATNYATFRIDGDNIDYVAAVQSVPGSFPYTSYNGVDFTTLDDTAPLQNLFDLRAKKTVIEDGVYMIKADTNSMQDGNYVGLVFDKHNDCELVIDGWLKAIPNSREKFHVLDVICCKNLRISGDGGVQGELLEHLGTSGQAGMCLSVSNTKNLTVEGLTFAYAWGDCIYDHPWSHGRTGTSGNDLQCFHTYKNVSIMYGGRTGYVSERGDHFVVDSCYFYGCGKVRGKKTFSAIDIEPQSGSYARDGVVKSWVRNYEFKNNNFIHNRVGLRIERCLNTSIHDNYFEDISDTSAGAITVVDHKDQWEVLEEYLPTVTEKWTKPILLIFNNNIRNSYMGIRFDPAASPDLKKVTNANIYGNLLVSCTLPFSSYYGWLEYCSIHDNLLYGCGSWAFSSLKINYCDFYNNKSYATKPNSVSSAGTYGRILRFDTDILTNSKGSKFHDNYFSHDYGKSFYGLGRIGTEEIYHGVALGDNQGISDADRTTAPSAIHFYNNYVSDDFYLPWSNVKISFGINTVRNESSEVFLQGDTFKSSYGDEGIVTSGALLSCSWLSDAEPFEEGMTVASGEIITFTQNTKTYYKQCVQGGTCGDTMTTDTTQSGDATFLSGGAEATTRGTLAIVYMTRGVCTSATHPATFNFKGRKMLETDTGKEIMYNGSAWVEITTAAIT